MERHLEINHIALLHGTPGFMASESEDVKDRDEVLYYACGNAIKPGCPVSLHR